MCLLICTTLHLYLYIYLCNNIHTCYTTANKYSILYTVHRKLTVRAYVTPCPPPSWTGSVQSWSTNTTHTTPLPPPHIRVNARNYFMVRVVNPNPNPQIKGPGLVTESITRSRILKFKKRLIHPLIYTVISLVMLVSVSYSMCIYIIAWHCIAHMCIQHVYTYHIL